MLPEKYRWLEGVGPLPRMLQVALPLLGTVEAPGADSNPVIMGWAAETGLVQTYSGDEIPWCGLFMAVCAFRAGKSIPRLPLWALSWSTWGNDSGQPELGDVLTFVREGGGHVAMYLGEDATTYHVLGGNQHDAVTITRIGKTRLKAVRNSYRTAAPASCRPYILQTTGAVSVNEA